MNQFLFPVATNLKGDGGDNRGHGNDEQGDYQKKCEQNITALPGTGPDVAGRVSDTTSSGTSLAWRCFPQNHTYPWVRGIFCGGPLPSTSWISTEFDDMRMTLYRRFTMSPSAAMNTSSPWERKIFLGSPGSLANPKNLRLMGGGACTGGGV